MIKIAYSDVSGLDFRKGYQLVSDSRREKIDQFRFEKDKKLSCGVELLLLKLLSDIGIDNPVFSLDEYGKPYLSNYSNIHFNMSHSGNYIACGISDSQIGLDIEYNDPEIDLNIAKHYFFKSEHDSIMNSRKPSDEFFKYWVLKESYMKYTGLGFRMDLDSFEVSKNKEKIMGNEELKLSLFDVEDYKLGVASKYKADKIEKVDLIL